MKVSGSRELIPVGDHIHRTDAIVPVAGIPPLDNYKEKTLEERILEIKLHIEELESVYPKKIDEINQLKANLIELSKRA